ncbi:hypothetical protein FAIPA1_20039 [Frankia sp. AiPs1]
MTLAESGCAALDGPLTVLLHRIATVVTLAERGRPALLHDPNGAPVIGQWVVTLAERGRPALRDGAHPDGVRPGGCDPRRAWAPGAASAMPSTSVANRAL